MRSIEQQFWTTGECVDRPDDRDDLGRFLRGDAQAFGQLVERHQAALLRYAAHRLGSGSAAEDVVQETFLRLLREAASLAGNESLAAWLFRVCRNLCADLARREVRMQQRHLRVAVPEMLAPATAEFELAEERVKVTELLRELPDHEREILILKVLEGKSYREIQGLLGVSLHDVFSTAHKALRKLATGMRAAGLA